MSESISKSVVWQVIGKFALQGIAFFTTPIFTRILTPENYGSIALYTSWLSILMVILSLQTYGSIANARIKYESERINEYLSSILSISVLTFGVFFILFFVFKDKVSILLGLDTKLVAILVIHSFFNYVIAFYVAYLDQFKKVKTSCLISISSTSLSTVLSLVFVFNFNNKVYGKIFGQIIPVILIGFILTCVVYIKGKTIWNVEYNKYCIAFTIPLVIHGLGHMIFTQCDRILIQKFQGEGQLGIYSVVYALCSVLVIIFNALNTAWMPFYYDYKKKNNDKEIIIHSKSYIKVIVLIMSGFVLLSYDVFKLMAPEAYRSGMTIIPIFVIAFYFNYLYLYPVNFEYFNEKTKMIPIATIVAAVLNILLDMVLIPKYSIFGASIATMIAQVLLFAFHFIMANFFIKNGFEYKLSFFVIPTLFLIVFCIISNLCMELFFIRWILFVVIAIYLLVDVIKRKSIF